MNQPVQPIPKRFWWLKRLGLVFVLALLLLVGLRLWWGHHANARLDALITEIEARGEPIHFDDMLRPPVPDDQNKAYFLRQALTQWPTVPGTTIRIDKTDWPFETDNNPDPITDNSAYLAQVEPILALIEQADAAPGCDWDVRLQRGGMYTLNMSYLGESRKLARLISDAVKRAKESDDTALTLRLIRQLVTLAETVNQYPPTLLGHLVGIAIHARADQEVEDLLPTLTIPSESNHPVRVEAERLLHQLTDELPLQESHHNAWVGERWSAYDTALSLLDNRIPLNSIDLNVPDFPDWMNAPLLAIFRPALVNDSVFQIKYHSNLIDTLEQDTAQHVFVTRFNQRYSDEYGMPAEDYLEANYYLYPISSWLGYIPDTINAHYRKICTRRMATLAMAIKLYESDHGQRPDTLDQLVPDYIPAIPLDPYAENGDTIRYRPEGAILVTEDSNDQDFVLAATGPAIVYSVGANGINNGGVVMVDDYDGKIDQGPRYNDEHNNDMWFLLDEPEEAYPLEPAVPDETE